MKSSLRKRLWLRWRTLERNVPILKEMRRYFRRYRADAYIVSFPKSGRTWLRFVLGRIIQKHYNLSTEKKLVLSPALMQMIEDENVPIIKATHDKSARGGVSYVGNNKKGYQGKNVLLLTRDIRDTLISYYYHRVKRNQDFHGTLSEFVRDEEFGANKIVQFYKSWYDNQHIPAALMRIRYEDMHADIERSVRDALAFMGLENIPDTVITSAIEEGRFKNMKQMEARQEIDFKGLNLRGEVDDPNAHKVRKGEVGGYINELTQEDLAYIDSVVEKYAIPHDWVYFQAD